MTDATTGPAAAEKQAGWGVIGMLAAAQFIMVLDTTVMNVSISTVAADLHTTIVGMQTAITLYTLVMAAFMLIGGKIGDRWGAKRAFWVGLIVYGIGSLITGFAGPADAAHRLVAHRGPGRHPRHPRHRRTDGDDLHRAAAGAVLRHPRRSGGRIDGRRPDHRRLGDRPPTRGATSSSARPWSCSSSCCS